MQRAVQEQRCVLSSLISCFKQGVTVFRQMTDSSVAFRVPWGVIDSE
jgi:hypothetical protein